MGTTFDATTYAEMTGARMGLRNFTDPKPLAAGDLVTSQYGDAEQFLGRVTNVCDDDVTVEWLSAHIGPARTTTQPRSYLVKASHSTHRDRITHGCFGSGIAAWLLSASEKGWHFVGHSGSGSPTSGYYEGTASAWLRGVHVSVRFAVGGEITWAKVIGEKYVGQPYAVVVDGPGAGHAACMWLIQSR